MLCGSARADKCAAVQRCGLWRPKTCLNSGVSIETSGNQFSPESPISSPHCPAPWYCRELPASIFPRASAVVLVEASRRGALVTLFRPAVASDRMTTQCGLTMVQPGRLTSEAKPTTRHPLGGTCGSLSGVLHPPTSAGRVTAAADVVFRRPQKCGNVPHLRVHSCCPDCFRRCASMLRAGACRPDAAAPPRLPYGLRECCRPWVHAGLLARLVHTII